MRSEKLETGHNASNRTSTNQELLIESYPCAGGNRILPLIEYNVFLAMRAAETLRRSLYQIPSDHPKSFSALFEWEGEGITTVVPFCNNPNFSWGGEGITIVVPFCHTDVRWFCFLAGEHGVSTAIQTHTCHSG